MGLYIVGNIPGNISNNALQ